MRKAKKKKQRKKIINDRNLYNKKWTYFMWNWKSRRQICKIIPCKIADYNEEMKELWWRIEQTKTLDVKSK